MPMRPVGITPVSVYRAPAYGVTGRTLTLTNTDTANPVYYSDGPGTIDAQSSFIAPGGTETFDGQSDVWLSTLSDSVTVTVQLKIGSSSYNPGSVSISNSNVDVNLTNSTVNVAGSVNNFNQVNITRIAGSPSVNAGSTMLGWVPGVIPDTAQGYMLAINPQNSGELYACDVQVEHIGPDGTPVGIEYFTVSNYSDSRSAGNFGQTAIRGKLIGSSVKISVWNSNSAWWQNVTATTLNVTSWIWLVFYATPFDYPSESQIVGSFNTRMLVPGFNAKTISAGETIDVCSSYEGMASVFAFNNSPAAATIQMLLRSYTVQNGSTPLGSQFFPQLTQGQMYNGLFAVNNLFNTVFVILSSGSSATIQYGITAVDLQDKENGHKCYRHNCVAEYCDHL